MTRSHETSKVAALRSSRGALVLCSVLSGAAPASLSAQLSHVPDTDRRSDVVARYSWNVAQVYSDEESDAPRFDDLRLSPNVLISPALRPAVAALLRDSVTFRRQCARFADSPSFIITVEDGVMPERARFRAATLFAVETNGRKLARVRLGSRVDLEEILAHEFEHIIEQLDGVDLRSLARRDTAGVHSIHPNDQFETERAIAVGRQVLKEARAARQTGM